MASMSRNNSNSNSLMGFSVHQPALGAALQFFPEMGSAQLDELINTYIPGPASILDKRTAVSLEFFDHAMTTGELFKFFLVYPAVASNTASPASTMQDSGYASSFNTSPNMADDNMWRQSSDSWPFSSAPKKARKSVKKAASQSSRAQSSDFSHIPGMKIMTKDGLDVTNSASRGCKTKEQRDHAHLMRVLKACDSCKRKKTRCDPSHKRSSSVAVSTDHKVSKKVKKAAAPHSQKPPSKTAAVTLSAALDSLESESYSFGSDFMAAPDISMDDWDQYIKYDEEINDVIPQDYYDFFDPLASLSPATDNYVSASSSQVLTPGLSQPVTPASGLEIGSGVELAGTDLLGVSDYQQPTLPYLNEAVEVGNNYLDFALYSPGSTDLDDELELSNDGIATWDHDVSISQSMSSRRKQDVRGGVTNSPQNNVLMGHSGLQSGQIGSSTPALGSTDNVFMKESIVQSDQNYRDPGHYLAQHSELSSRVTSNTGSRTIGLADTPESRVPCVTVSPNKLLLGELPPRPGSQPVHVAADNNGPAAVLSDGIKRRHSRQQVLAVNDGDNAPAAPASILYVQERTPTVVFTTAPTTTTTATTVGASIEQTFSGDEQRRHIPSVAHESLFDDRHQRRIRPDKSVSSRMENGIIYAGVQSAAQPTTSATDFFTNGISSGRTNGNQGTITQGTFATQVRASSSSDIKIFQSDDLSQRATTSQATVISTAGITTGIQPSVFPVSGILTATVACGLKAISLVRAGNAGLGSVFHMVILSSIFVVAMAFGSGLPSSSWIDPNQSLSFISATTVALFFVAMSTMSQQSLVYCENKMDQFAQALQSVGRWPGKAFQNAKSKIHKIQSGLIISDRRSTVPAFRNLANLHMGLAF